VDRGSSRESDLGKRVSKRLRFATRRLERKAEGQPKAGRTRQQSSMAEIESSESESASGLRLGKRDDGA